MEPFFCMEFEVGVGWRPVFGSDKQANGCLECVIGVLGSESGL